MRRGDATRDGGGTQSVERRGHRAAKAVVALVAALEEIIRRPNSGNARTPRPYLIADGAGRDGDREQLRRLLGVPMAPSPSGPCLGMNNLRPLLGLDAAQARVAALTAALVSPRSWMRPRCPCLDTARVA
jgi:hypothetical protein